MNIICGSILSILLIAAAAELKCTWKTVQSYVNIPWNPDEQSFSFTTNSVAGSDEEVEVYFIDIYGNLLGGVGIFYSSQIEYVLGGCSSWYVPFPTLPTARQKIWTIKYHYSEQRVVYYCDGEEVANLLLTSVCTESDWRDYWDIKPTQIQFYSTASDSYCISSIPDPVDGVWKEWGEWDDCSRDCGGGTRSKSRDCNEPFYGGSDCVGGTAVTEDCKKEPCPVARTEVTLKCFEDKMVITFSSPNAVDRYSFTGAGENCNPSADATEIEVSLHECGTSGEHNTTHIVYENTLSGSSASGGSSTINRGAMTVIKIKCAYRNEGTTNVLSWTAGESVVDMDGVGVFTFSLSVYGSYSNNVLGSRLSSPFKLKQRDAIYFQITAEVESSLDLTVEILQIIAMDSSDIDAVTNNKYYLVRDGCVKDSTYAALVPSAATSMTKAFSMEAFNFASNGTAAVYIHGVVKICDKNEANFATCKDICKSRKRREVDLVSASNYPDGLKVYGGPFFFGDEFESVRGNTDKVAQTASLLILCQLCVFVLGC